LRVIDLSAFAIDELEVTVADYLACVTSTHAPCRLPGRSRDGDASPYNFGAPGREDHPVNGVTWDQAGFYCDRLDKRLPTEAEWEKAARGSYGARYPWGSSAPTCDRANLAIGGPGCGSGSTIPTGQLAGGVSPVGAFDMAGNVAEWIADYYAANYYETSPSEDPLGPASGTARVVRGGSWLDPTTHARTSARDFDVEPSSAIGFRCARSIP
jgi:formylglycine-generating enzyme required for sulfatase activity